MALDHFERLLENCTKEELVIVDEILKSRREFTIYTNLSRTFSNGTSVLDELPTRLGDDFRRQGLAWVMALARVEYGAIMAGFTSTPNPFQEMQPTPFEMQAYLELLADGLRCHYWALVNDSVAQRPRQAGLTPSQAITYVRRVHLTRSFLTSIMNYAKPDLAPAQISELKAWDRRMQELLFVLLYDVLKLGTGNVDSQTTDSENKDYAIGGISVSESALSGLPSCVSGAVNSNNSSPPSPGSQGSP